jgi:hypothetical protein
MSGWVPASKVADGRNRSWIQLCHAVGAAFWLPALGTAIIHVVLMIPQKEVAGIDALGIVTVVKNPQTIWDWPVV